MLTRMRQDAEAMREAGCTADEAYAASPWDQFGLLRWASLLLSCCKARWQIFRFRQELAFWHAASERDPHLPPLRHPEREILDPRLPNPPLPRPLPITNPDEWYYQHLEFISVHNLNSMLANAERTFALKVRPTRDRLAE